MPIRGVLKMIAIPNMNKPKECWECPCINDSDCRALELLEGDSRSYEVPFREVRPDCPLIDIVTCGECKWFIKQGKGNVGKCTYRTRPMLYCLPTDFCSYGERRADEKHK